MFIVVSGKEYRMREVPAYLYAGQSVAVQPVETRFCSMLIVDTGSPDRDRYGINLKDRLASGMFGSVLFETLAEAQAYIEEAKK